MHSFAEELQIMSKIVSQLTFPISCMSFCGTDISFPHQIVFTRIIHVYHNKQIGLAGMVLKGMWRIKIQQFRRSLHHN